jgi:hypothetical protein
MTVNAIDSAAHTIMVSGDMGPGDWVLTGPGPFFAPVSPVNFGTVPTGQSKMDSIVVMNSGNTLLTIDSARSTSTEFVVSPTSGSLAPGASEKYYITYSPSSSGAAAAAILFYHDGINGMDSVKVTGSLFATFVATPDSIDFGTIVRNASKLDSISVANGGNLTLTVDSVKSTDAAFSVSPMNASIEAGMSGKFTITYHPTSGGAKHGLLVFYSNSTASPDTAWVMGDVTIAPAFSATPTALNFGTIFTGQNKIDSISVTNVGTSTLVISSVTSNNAVFTVSPTSANIGVDTTKKFYVTFTPAATGTQSAKIAFVHNAATHDTLTATGGALTIGSVRQARLAANGTEVVFEAIVTRAKGNYTYVQDTSGGLNMYQSSGAWKDSVTSGGIRAGDMIRVDGRTSEYNSLKEITAADLLSFTIISRDNTVPAPQQVTLLELKNHGEDYESELVKVIGVTVTTGGDAAYVAAKTYMIADASDNSNAVSLRIPNAGDSDVDGVTIIPVITFTGVIAQYSSSDPAAGYQLMAINATDVADNSLSADDLASGIPETFQLHNNYPNPFNPSTTIQYDLPNQSKVTLRVYSILGQEVSTLVDGIQSASYHRIQWNGRDNNGMQVSSGVYFFRITAIPVGGKAQPFTQVRKMMLMK